MMAVVVGIVCGVLSGLGIGGGSLLMVWMTAVAGLEQNVARGINLLYFLPTALGALFFHKKNRLLQWRVLSPAAVAGSVTAAVCAYVAGGMDTELLRRLFGLFLLPVGLRELFYRDKNAK